MMREDKVLSARMDIDLVAQILLGHDRTLDMPARTSLTPWRLPVRFPIFFWLPENKIRRILFAFLSRHLDLTEAGLQILDILMGQLSIAVK